MVNNNKISSEMVEYLIDLTLNTIPESLLTYKNSIFLISESCIIPEASINYFTHLNSPESYRPSSEVQAYYTRVFSDFHRGLTISKFLKLFSKLIILTNDRKKFTSIVPNFRVHSYNNFKQEDITNLETKTPNHKINQILVTRKPYDDENEAELRQNFEMTTKGRSGSSSNRRNLSKTFNRSFANQAETRTPMEWGNTEGVDEDKAEITKESKIVRYVYSGSKEKFFKIESNSSHKQASLRKEKDYLLHLSKICNLDTCKIFLDAYKSISYYLIPKTGINIFKETIELIQKLFDNNILEFVDGSRKFSLDLLQNYQYDLIKCNYNHFTYFDNNL